MTCRTNDDDVFVPPPLVRCPCEGCEGHLRFDGFNRHRTLAFLACSDCAHGCEVHVPMIRTWGE